MYLFRPSDLARNIEQIIADLRRIRSNYRIPSIDMDGQRAHIQALDIQQAQLADVFRRIEATQIKPNTRRAFDLARFLRKAIDGHLLCIETILEKKCGHGQRVFANCATSHGRSGIIPRFWHCWTIFRSQLGLPLQMEKLLLGFLKQRALCARMVRFKTLAETNNRMASPFYKHGDL